MTLANAAVVVAYTGDGTSTGFAVPFAFFGLDEIAVYAKTAGASPVALVRGTHYAVTGGNGTTGTIVAATAPPTGTTWIVRRSTIAMQQVDYTDFDAFPAAAHEGALDRLTAISQEEHEALLRGLRAPVGESALPALPELAARAGQFLAFDGSGNPIGAQPTVGTLAVSAAMAPVLLAGSVAAGFNLLAANGGTVAAGGLKIGAGGIDITGGGTVAGGLKVNSGGLNIVGGGTVSSGMTVSTGGLNIVGGGTVSGGMTVSTGGLKVAASGFDIAGDGTLSGGMTIGAAGTTGNQGINFSQFAPTSTTPGKIRLPGGVTIQWGNSSGPTVGIVFPVAFSAAPWTVQCTLKDAPAGGSAIFVQVLASSFTASGFTAATVTGPSVGVAANFFWFAIGPT